ncbi:MAG: hypothetical protein AAF502_24985, partial [Bacteroidota bacterium]
INSKIENVRASDGEYLFHVQVIWDLVPSAIGYRVYRSLTPDFKEKVEISKGLKENSWLADYTAARGVFYYYKVQGVANYFSKTKLSLPDKGYIKEIPIANPEDSIRLSIEERKRTGDVIGGIPPSFSVSFRNIEIENLRNKNQLLTQGIIKNTGTILLENVILEFFLSNDTALDSSDRYLGRFEIDEIGADRLEVFAKSLNPGKNLNPGTNFLIVTSKNSYGILGDKAMEFSF